MTDIEIKVGHITWKYSSYTDPLTSLRPCVPVIKTVERHFRADHLVSLHADPRGKVTATRVWPTEDGNLAKR